MKATLAILFLCGAPASPVFGADRTDSSVPSDKSGISAVVTRAASYKSGDSLEPLRQIENFVREAQTNPAMRKQIESELLKALPPSATVEARRFACTQLAAIGSDATLPGIALLLESDTGASFACLALSTYPPGKADKLLRDTLPASRDLGRLQIISLLGDRRDAQAVDQLAAIVRNKDPYQTRIAIISLAKIGTPSAQKALDAVRRNSAPELEPTFAEADLRIAEHLAKARDAKAAAAIYEKLIGSTQPPEIRRGAFAALVRLDKDGGEQRILQMLRSDDSVLRPVAIAAVRSLTSKTASEKFAQELPNLAPAEQVWLIDSLAARHDAAARTALVASLGSAHAEVRRAAAAALAGVGGAEAVRPFANAIANAPDTDEARALESALGSLPPGRETDQTIITEIRAARGQARAWLVSALATRPSPQATGVLLEEADNADPVVAKAAYRVLARAGADDALPALVNKFAALRDAALRSEVEGFVEQAASATEDATRRSAVVHDALGRARETEARCALLRLLPACGDAAALAALNSAVSDADSRVQDAAVRALAEWPDLAGWDSLFAIWTKPASDAQRSLALHGLVRLADEANAAPDEKLIARYRELIEGARGDHELKQVLSALGGAANPEALKLALPLLDRPGVRPEAKAAVKKIAEAIKAKHPEVAKAALDRIAGK